MGIPEAVAAFRADHRRRYISPRYSGVLHFAFCSVGSLAVIAWALPRLHGVSLLEWLTVPAAFLFGNLVEYRGHRGPMHHRTPPLGILFERHTMQHHHFYTHEAMAAESTRDFQMVLFPPMMLIYFLGGFLFPPTLLLHYAVSPNVALLFLVTGLGYFITYEWLHLAYHLPEGSLVGRLPLLRTLRRLHRKHHDPAQMQSYNFNITFPIFDAVFGTRYPGPYTD